MQKDLNGEIFQARSKRSESAYRMWGDAERRFWSKVKIGTQSECWPWIGGGFRNGYGSVTYLAKKRIAHRLAYFFTYGPFNQSLDCCHKCDNPSCCNPNHLFLGSAKENMADCLKKGRCKRASGVNNGKSKLTKEQAMEILSDLQCSRAHRKELADKFGVTYSCICHVIYGDTWSWLNRLRT